MLIPGMASITFRKLQPVEIIKLAAFSGLKAIEWGSDIHIPCNDIKRASEVGRMTRDAGLEVASYGTYYRVGVDNKKEGCFGRITDTALTLGTNQIRVWAGNKSSLEINKNEWEEIIHDMMFISDYASRYGLTISFEYHKGTANDNSEASIRLLQTVNHPALKTYWQHRSELDVTETIAEINKLALWISNIHVFYWIGSIRRELREGFDVWMKHFSAISNIKGNRYVLLEYVKDDLVEQLYDDAKTLIDLVSFADS